MMIIINNNNNSNVFFFYTRMSVSNEAYLWKILATPMPVKHIC